MLSKGDRVLLLTVSTTGNFLMLQMIGIFIQANEFQRKRLRHMFINKQIQVMFREVRKRAKRQKQTRPGHCIRRFWIKSEIHKWSITGSRVAQWKRAGPITQRSVDRNHALLRTFWIFFFKFLNSRHTDCMEFMAEKWEAFLFTVKMKNITGF